VKTWDKTTERKGCYGLQNRKLIRHFIITTVRDEVSEHCFLVPLSGLLLPLQDSITMINKYLAVVALLKDMGRRR